MGRAINSLIKQDGIRGLWKGILPTYYRDVPFSAIYWMNYETIKSFYNGPSNVPSFGLSFIAGAMSGSVSINYVLNWGGFMTNNQIV